MSFFDFLQHKFDIGKSGGFSTRNSLSHLFQLILFLLPGFKLHHHNNADLHLGYSSYNSSNGLSSHLNPCICNLWINSLAVLETKGCPYFLQLAGIVIPYFHASYTIILIPYFCSRYFMCSFVAVNSNPGLMKMYVILWYISTFSHISITISLSEPAEMKQHIFWYWLLLIMLHARMKLSPIV